MKAGTRVRHKLFGLAITEELNESLHHHYKEAGLCFIKLEDKPKNFSTDIILTFEDELTEV